MGHSAKEADLLTTNMYHFIKDLINLIFPKGFKFNLDKKITTPQLSIPFNEFRDNFSDKSHLVEPRGIEPLTSTLPA